MAADITRTGDGVVVALSGRLNYRDSAGFAAVLNELADLDFAACRIDLHGLEMMDSAGLRMLFVVHDLCRAREVPMTIGCGAGQVRDLLFHCRMDLLVPIEG